MNFNTKYTGNLFYLLRTASIDKLESYYQENKNLELTKDHFSRMCQLDSIDKLKWCIDTYNIDIQSINKHNQKITHENENKKKTILIWLFKTYNNYPFKIYPRYEYIWTHIHEFYKLIPHAFTQPILWEMLYNSYSYYNHRHAILFIMRKLQRITLKMAVCIFKNKRQMIMCFEFFKLLIEKTVVNHKNYQIILDHCQQRFKLNNRRYDMCLEKYIISLGYNGKNIELI